ncbi:hypothetical protein CEXT_146591 [Caerostris extrusa]|uniref:Uncharacterized protein n=1 Tax=Caerostris extrusa TaxID=172846 RepID=A0AAV4P3C5_CAEEX|nr:hypothetical protein CEXT_146591 [Caerostris extrusa]
MGMPLMFLGPLSLHPLTNHHCQKSSRCYCCDSVPLERDNGGKLPNHCKIDRIETVTGCNSKDPEGVVLKSGNDMRRRKTESGPSFPGRPQQSASGPDKTCTKRKGREITQFQSRDRKLKQYQEDNRGIQ